MATDMLRAFLICSQIFLNQLEIALFIHQASQISYEFTTDTKNLLQIATNPQCIRGTPNQPQPFHFDNHTMAESKQ